MQLSCGRSWEEWHNARAQWHRWFAWRPVRLESGDCRWLEYVERRVEFFSLCDCMFKYYRQLNQ